MTLDSKIVNHHILKNKTECKTENESQIWREVVNLNKKAFKDQGENKSLKFQGTIKSDGIGMSVIKQNTTTNRKTALPKIKNNTKAKNNVKNKNEESDDNTLSYIESLTPTELVKTKDKCVLIDPGRRDML